MVNATSRPPGTLHSASGVRGQAEKFDRNRGAQNVKRSAMTAGGDVASAKQVIRQSANSGAGRLRLTTQTGNAAELAALALLTANTDLLSVADAARLVAAGVTRVRTAAATAFAGTTTGDDTGGVAEDLFTTSVAHGLVAGERIAFTVQTGATLPTVGVEYSVMATSLTTTAFTLALGYATTPAIDMGADISVGTWHKVPSTWGDAVLAIAAS